MFVADGRRDRVTPYVYVGGELAAGRRASATGNTFAAAALTFDPATVLDGVTEELPESDVVLVHDRRRPGGAVQYTARRAVDAGRGRST